MPRHAARQVWTGADLLRDHAVVTDGGGRIVALEPAPDAPPGLLTPGLVNAHTHLELSWLAGRVAGGAGSVAWVRELNRVRGELGAQWSPRERQTRLDAWAEEAARQAVLDCLAAGVAFVVDVANQPGAAGLITDPIGSEGSTDGEAFPGEPGVGPGLRGVVEVELLGTAESRWRPRLSPPDDAPGVRHRVTAHSPISCHPDLLRAVLAERPIDRPAPTLHCDEDPADRLLLAERGGPWAVFHRELSRWMPDHDWDGGLGRGASGVQVLRQLDLLGEHLGLVHLVAADDADLDAVADSGATAILCPRSNLHIGGRLPDTLGMVRRGIPLALGTDSLASSPSLDLLAEAAALRATAPAIPPEVWMTALTAGGAALLADPDAGHLRPGARPGLLRFEIPATDDPLAALLDGTPWPRTWLP